MSLVDRKQIVFDMDFNPGEVIEIANPLGASIDLADMFVENENRSLMSSPFLQSWTNETEQVFSTTTGIWLSVTADRLYLKFGIGSREAVNESISSAVFFVVPDKFQTSAKKMYLDIICMN